LSANAGACVGPEQFGSGGLFERPDFYDSLCDCAWRFLHTPDGLCQVGRLDQGKAGDGQSRIHEGSRLNLHAGAIVVAHLRGHAGYAHHTACSAQLLVM
jgi:hypothetical protein